MIGCWISIAAVLKIEMCTEIFASHSILRLGTCLIPLCPMKHKKAGRYGRLSFLFK